MLILFLVYPLLFYLFIYFNLLHVFILAYLFTFYFFSFASISYLELIVLMNKMQMKIGYLKSFFVFMFLFS